MRIVASDQGGDGEIPSPRTPTYLRAVGDNRADAPLSPWTILVVDDEEDVHRLIDLIVDGMQVRGSPINIEHAYSAAEARTKLSETEMSVVLLDVMMETDSAGLDLVRFIREHLSNGATRIVIFTGQPGLAPEPRVVDEYDINGYLNKADVTSQRLTSMLVTSLRMYADYKTIQAMARNQRQLAEELNKRNENLEQVNRELRLAAVKNQLLTDELATTERAVDTLVEQKTETLTREKERAELANQAKSNFIASMNHELRNPLQTILGYTDLLLDSPEEGFSQATLTGLSEISKAGQHMLALINDILELSRMEHGALKLSMEPVSLVEAVDECCGLMEQMARDGEVEFLNATPPELPEVTANARSVKQVLINLISNAIKYNQSSGSVEVSATVGDGVVEVQVKDTGIGIPRELQQRIFEPFDRLAATDQSGAGTGIGLSISQRLLKEMRSELRFTSVEGEGSTFYFALPIVDEDSID